MYRVLTQWISDTWIFKTDTDSNTKILESEAEIVSPNETSPPEKLKEQVKELKKQKDYLTPEDLKKLEEQLNGDTRAFKTDTDSNTKILKSEANSSSVYKCDICHTYLQRHEVTNHYHPCNHCEKKFTEKRSLKQHVTLNHDVTKDAGPMELCGKQSPK